MHPTCCPVLELRQYTLYPGQRDTLIALFDREFVESQEAVGMRVLGQFRDRNAPDRFVWLRGFPDMAARKAALEAFYFGPVWKAHRTEANATMADASDVLLLRPVHPGAGFAPPRTPRPPVGERTRPSSRLVATLYFLDAPVDAGFLRFFEQQVAPLLAEAGARPVAVLQSEPAENTFPALPVREGEHVLAWFAVFESEEQLAAHQRRLAQSLRWAQEVLPALRARLKTAPQQLTLEPTARSQLR